MTSVVAVLNIILGAVYVIIGVLIVIDMKRNWKTMGWSHFGLAFIALAFTCGPHHFIHGVHIAFEGRSSGVLDLVAVGIGMPAAAIWAFLRVESLAGGRGDRFISDTPAWMHAIPIVSAAALTGLLSFVLTRGGDLKLSASILPNALLVGIYLTIGYFLLRTQLQNRGPLGGWSVSGISLTLVFPTCAMMHAVYGYYSATGRYHYDVHGFVIDWVAVPAGLYFLWVVRSLYRDSLRDWNRVETPERILLLDDESLLHPEISVRLATLGVWEEADGGVFTGG